MSEPKITIVPRPTSEDEIADTATMPPTRVFPGMRKLIGECVRTGVIPRENHNKVLAAFGLKPNIPKPRGGFR